MKMRVRKKPVEVEAWLFDEKKWQDDKTLYPMVEVNNPISSPMLRDKAGIVTLEGIMTVSDGDYIIKGVNGEFYPCKPDIFHKTYDVLDSD